MFDIIFLFGTLGLSILAALCPLLLKYGQEKLFSKIVLSGLVGGVGSVLGVIATVLVLRYMGLGVGILGLLFPIISAVISCLLAIVIGRAFFIKKEAPAQKAAVESMPVEMQSADNSEQISVETTVQTTTENVAQPATQPSNPMMKKCPVCGKEIAKSAKACPNCGAKNKKPIYKRAWVCVLAAVLALVVFVKISFMPKDFEMYIETDDGGITMMASEMRELVEKDEATYNRLYYGKNVRFVAEIEETHGKTTYTNIGKTYKYSLDFANNITAGFSETYAFSVGDTVIVEGRLSSHVYDYVYIDGAFVY